jgi:superfamily II DNA or RNA helicase
MLVIPEKRKIVINSTANSAVASAVPHARAFTHNGEALVAMDYGIDESLVLKNLGFHVPAPILHFYDWPARFAPMEHQKETAAFLTMHKRALCLNAPGTGKTLSSIWAADFLLQEGHARKVLIVAPLSTVKVVWGRELRHHLPHRSFVICTGTRQKREELLAQPGVQYVIINHDGFTNMQSSLTGFDVVIYDEATALKTPGSQRFKTFYKWVQTNQPWLWLLTGTPISQTPTDAWSLARLVDAPLAPRSYTTFKDMVMQKVTTFKWVPRKDALDICKKVLQPSIRFSLDECKDLPDTNFVGRRTEMTPQQTKAFKDMKDKAVTVFAAGEVTAPNAAVVLSKLLQICCIAYNTDVLTDKGWVPIQNVTDSHKVWDGEEWVSQGGSIYMGAKEIVRLDGVRMTPDHKVWVGRWETAGDILNGDASGRFNRPEVRLPDGFGSRQAASGENKNRTLVMSVRLRNIGGEAESISTQFKSIIPAKLRLPPWQRNSQNGKDSSISYMDKHATTMRRSYTQRLQKLWSTGYLSLCKLARLVRSFLGRHATWLRRYIDIGSYRREWSVHQSQLSMGYASGAKQQPSGACSYTNTKRCDDNLTSSTPIQHKTSDAICAYKSLQVANIAGTDRVYDLINCGPRNRFVVRGDEGQLLVVHNCGVVYGDNQTIAIDATARYNTLTELLDEIGDKVIIYVPLKGVQNWLFERLQIDKYDVALVNGDTSKKNRDQIFNDFQHTDSIRILLAHPKVAAHGLTLTRAKDIIWYAPIYSLEQYEQANARIRRLSTTGKTTVWHIWATEFEAELYRRLRLKQNTLAEFLALVQGVNSDQ